MELYTYILTNFKISCEKISNWWRHNRLFVFFSSLAILVGNSEKSSHLKGGANRANILVNIARQHLLLKMLSRFAVATNMLAKGKIPQNVAPTFINIWTTLFASFASCFNLLYPNILDDIFNLWSFFYVIRIFISFSNVFPPFLIKQQQSLFLIIRLCFEKSLHDYFSKRYGGRKSI